MPEPICSICKTVIVELMKHRECLLKGLESGEVQSRRDWLAKSKPKVRKMIRKVLLEQTCDINLPESVYDRTQNKV